MKKGQPAGDPRHGRFRAGVLGRCSRCMGAGFSFAGALVRNQRLLEIVGGAVLVLLGALLVGLTMPGLHEPGRAAPARQGAPGAGRRVRHGSGLRLRLDALRRADPRLASSPWRPKATIRPAGLCCSSSTRWAWASPSCVSGLFVGFALRAFARIRRHLRVDPDRVRGHPHRLRRAAHQRGVQLGCRPDSPAGASGSQSLTPSPRNRPVLRPGVLARTARLKDRGGACRRGGTRQA